MSGLFCIWRSGKAEEQVRVTEMRDTKSGKSRAESSQRIRDSTSNKKAELDNPALLLVFSLLSFSNLLLDHKDENNRQCAD